MSDAGDDAGRDGGYDAGLDGGADGGPCPHSQLGQPTIDDAGVRCVCEVDYLEDGGHALFECCDPDVGNPCPVCCFNPRESDGGRRYDPFGTPVCYC
jgi:hypothetical protein